MKDRISKVLRQARKKNNFSVEDVVNKLKKYNIKISAKTIYGYETGFSNPNADMFVFLCRLYGINNLNIFFDGTEYDFIDEEIEDYTALNDNGKKKVKDYVSDLLANTQYRKNKINYTKEWNRYVDATLKHMDEKNPIDFDKYDK